MMSSHRLTVGFSLFALTFSTALLGSTARAASPAAPPTPMPNSIPTLEVMTLNMEHHDDPEELKAMAAHLKTDLPKIPDFILCQEVLFERHGTKADPEDSTAAVFAKYLGYYCKGTKRTSDREGIAILSRYPFAHYDAINLKSQTLRLLLGFRRVSVMGEFNVPGMGLVRVTDTHLTNWEFEGHVRRGQIAETLAWVSAREKQVPAAANLFGGDFNAKNNWSEMQQIKESGKLGGVEYKDYNGTDYTQGWHGSPSKRIDFIFVAASPRGLAMQFVGEKLLWKTGLFKADGDHFYPSDHLGVVHTYAIGNAAKQPNVRTANVNE